MEDEEEKRGRRGKLRTKKEAGQDDVWCKPLADACHFRLRSPVPNLALPYEMSSAVTQVLSRSLAHVCYRRFQASEPSAAFQRNPPRPAAMAGS